MKVIDILNKIANGEEVPKHIKKKSIDMYWNKENYCYDIKTENMYAPCYLFYCDELNDEIEIKEESKEELEEIELIETPKIDHISNMRICNAEYKINELIENQNKIIRELKDKK